VETAVDILLFIAVVAQAVQVGGQIFVLLAVIPALPEFPLETSARFHQRAMTFRPHNYLRIAGGTPVPASVAILIIQGEFPFEMVLVAIGLVCCLFNLYWSWREWPINDEVNSWGTDPEPVREKYPALRAQWDRQHVIRTIGATVGLLAFVLAAILYEG
jgi:hypothetical protein